VNDEYGLWSFDPDAESLLTEVALDASPVMPRGQRLLQVGGYLLKWGPARSTGEGPTDWEYPYHLLAWDAESGDPLNASPLMSGAWKLGKFVPYPLVAELGEGYCFADDAQDLVELHPFTNFILSFLPTEGRGTYQLWNFDPGVNLQSQYRDRLGDDPSLADPIATAYDAARSFQTIRAGSELFPIGNYCLERKAESGELVLWSFDPQDDRPLSYPPIDVPLPDIDASRSLVVIGRHLLAWSIEDMSYQLWSFDPTRAEPFGTTVKSGTLPAEPGNFTSLTAFLPRRRTEARVTAEPGTFDFMRSKVKHVVHYMVESRSFDNVLGWLYETGNDGIHFVGSDEPFEGASTDHFNEVDGTRYQQDRYENPQQGRLNVPNPDLVHGFADSLLQMFGPDLGYDERATPDMSGFVLNTGNPQVMHGMTPDQLPIMNGLAKSFGVSDRWFCSIPAGTDVNRAFPLTGSAQNLLYSYETGTPYRIFPETPRRPSYFKLLWSYGIRDWRIYWSMCWMDFVFTYHLYLKGQIPSIDKIVTNEGRDYVSRIEHFIEDAQNGELPAFSYLEPIWFVMPDGVGTNSYHPSTDLLPGEIQLNRIYEALSQGDGTKWEDTLFFITFSKNGGTYDHVSPPYAQKPWPNDSRNGFEFDLLGPRVPAIVVSPWIREKTVFRSGVRDVPFDATSFTATLLEWFGIPRSQWRLGDRMEAAPTFEAALNSAEPRSAPTFPDPERYPGATNPQVPKDCSPLG
ncbi:MAG TPA: alkaline phosphatase family protein, partial [Longimicrobiales bacterium]|nr:alkaline phosphatase family protein [Longimicrobiales bacterium]